jgi:hypothetical protein
LRRTAAGTGNPYVRINAAQSLARLVGTPCRPFLEGLKKGIPKDASPADRTVLEKGLDYAISECVLTGGGSLADQWK